MEREQQISEIISVIENKWLKDSDKNLSDILNEIDAKTTYGILHTKDNELIKIMFSDSKKEIEQWCHNLDIAIVYEDTEVFDKAVGYYLYWVGEDLLLSEACRNLSEALNIFIDYRDIKSIMLKQDMTKLDNKNRVIFKTMENAEQALHDISEYLFSKIE